VLIRLNIGAGATDLPGYIAIDRKLGSEAYPLAYEDGSVDEIRASHVLEHFGHQDVADVLLHWVSKLKPGGCLKIAVPDFELVAREYLAGKPINVQGYTMGGQCDGDDYHRCIWDREALHEAMVHAGLERIGRWESDANDCSSLPVSLNLVGFKPTTSDTVVRNTVGVLASARFGPAIHHKCTYEALSLLNIPYQMSIGCFWHQILSEGIERAIASPAVEYVITGDFDSVYSASDVLELYRLMRCYPEADAICPLQSKRGGGLALFTINGEDGRPKSEIPSADFARNLTRIDTGHFGLTIFRAERLREFPRPWMQPKPTPNGTWGPGRIDADIDWWRNWANAGFSLYLANRVVIGHLEEVVTWPTANFTPYSQSFDDYAANGIPAEAKRC
jgi:hypothetical protein